MGYIINMHITILQFFLITIHHNIHTKQKKKKKKNHTFCVFQCLNGTVENNALKRISENQTTLLCKFLHAEISEEKKKLFIDLQSETKVNINNNIKC